MFTIPNSFASSNGWAGNDAIFLEVVIRTVVGEVLWQFCWWTEYVTGSWILFAKTIRNWITRLVYDGINKCINYNRSEIVRIFQFVKKRVE